MTIQSSWKDRLGQIRAVYQSDTQDTVLRLLNAFGTLGFGYEAGYDLFGFLFSGPNAQFFASALGALFVASILDLQYAFWTVRTRIANTSTEQRRIAKLARSVSMWSSAVLTFAFFILRFVDWLTNDPTQAANISLMITRTLAIGTTAVLIFQFWKNDQFKQADPANQRLQAENDIDASRLDMELDLRIETETIRQAAYAEQYRTTMQEIGRKQGNQDARKLHDEMHSRLEDVQAMTPGAADSPTPPADYRAFVNEAFVNEGKQQPPMMNGHGQ